MDSISVLVDPSVTRLNGKGRELKGDRSEDSGDTGEGSAYCAIIVAVALAFESLCECPRRGMMGTTGIKSGLERLVRISGGAGRRTVDLALTVAESPWA